LRVASCRPTSTRSWRTSALALRHNDGACRCAPRENTVRRSRSTALSPAWTAISPTCRYCRRRGSVTRSEEALRLGGPVVECAACSKKVLSRRCGTQLGVRFVRDYVWVKTAEPSEPSALEMGIGSTSRGTTWGASWPLRAARSPLLHGVEPLHTPHHLVAAHCDPSVAGRLLRI